VLPWTGAHDILVSCQLLCTSALVIAAICLLSAQGLFMLVMDEEEDEDEDEDNEDEEIEDEDIEDEDNEGDDDEDDIEDPTGREHGKEAVTQSKVTRKRGPPSDSDLDGNEDDVIDDDVDEGFCKLLSCLYNDRSSHMMSGPRSMGRTPGDVGNDDDDDVHDDDGTVAPPLVPLTGTASKSEAKGADVDDYDDDEDVDIPPVLLQRLQLASHDARASIDDDECAPPGPTALCAHSPIASRYLLAGTHSCTGWAAVALAAVSPGACVDACIFAWLSTWPLSWMAALAPAMQQSPLQAYRRLCQHDGLGSV
jgi:hypothetical protein